MVVDPRLLVVDDEEAICEGCRRIFSRQGFQVEKTSDAREGLSLAEENQYAAILLDIKMPNMTGIEFLEQLRAKRRDVPVILMTGYPSVPNAISAVRLGAAGYVTKPFTPEEITQAVQQHVRAPAGESGAAAPAAETWSPAAEGFYFWNESWLQPGEDGSVRVGAMVARTQGGAIQGVRLPRIGEAVYQGLPLAEVTFSDRPSVLLPAPISGVVVALNEALAGDPARLAGDPCRTGWLASVCPTRFEEETKECLRRRMILVNGDEATARAQQERLTGLGCQVRLARSWEDLSSPLHDERFQVVMLDAASFGREGPALVAKINASAPGARIVLVAGPNCQLEATYRAHRIFYYAVEPFADNEIADILDAVFRLQSPSVPKKERQKVPPGAIANINVINNSGTMVRLLAAPGLLRRDQGLGLEIRHKLLDRLFPIETTAGDTKINAADLAKAASSVDRLVVLLAKDVGRLPGSLVRDTKWEYISVAGDGPGNVTTLVVQPATEDGGLCGFSARTTAALAGHIVNDLASY